ncbi:RidA family protein [Emcibacter sp.]|uniref:RidA family protein n=1 Tax=Emcibacter sp. TaxID=1979954 RepID=UPI002AA652E0|nr:RidA family protein [Emcibacter sp.]
MTIERLGNPPVLTDGTKVPLSPAVRVGDYIYLSGVLPMRPEGGFSEDDIEAQTRQCIANIKQVLESAGASLENVFKTTIWLVRKEDFPRFNAIYAEAFGAHPPVRSTVCSELMVPGALVEIEAIAQASEK